MIWLSTSETQNFKLIRRWVHSKYIRSPELYSIMQEALQLFDGVLAVYIKDLICAWFPQKSKKILQTCMVQGASRNNPSNTLYQKHVSSTDWALCKAWNVSLDWWKNYMFYSHKRQSRQENIRSQDNRRYRWKALLTSPKTKWTFMTESSLPRRSYRVFGNLGFPKKS